MNYSSTFEEFRIQAFKNPLFLEKSNSQSVQVLIADWHRGNGIVTLILAVDGTVSLYFSNGSSILGCGLYESVQLSTNRLLNLAEQFYKDGQKVGFSILPDKGQIQFYFRTSKALYWLPGGSNPAHASFAIVLLFKAMNEIISCIREINQGGADGL